MPTNAFSANPPPPFDVFSSREFFYFGRFGHRHSYALSVDLGSSIHLCEEAIWLSWENKKSPVVIHAALFAKTKNLLMKIALRRTDDCKYTFFWPLIELFCFSGTNILIYFFNNQIYYLECFCTIMEPPIRSQGRYSDLLAFQQLYNREYIESVHFLDYRFPLPVCTYLQHFHIPDLSNQRNHLIDPAFYCSRYKVVLFLSLFCFFILTSIIACHWFWVVLSENLNDSAHIQFTF